MDPNRYREAVAENARKHGFSEVDLDGTFDPVWSAQIDDPSIDDVYLLATVVDGTGFEPADVASTADRFRGRLAERVDEHDRSTTPIGYVVIAVEEADDALVSAATDYTVAGPSTNVFPIVYDCAEEVLHAHPVPRLKGRGIYRRQADDARRLFEP